jgi:hypothetical protein
MQTSTAQVRVVKSPNKHAPKCFRFYVAFNSTQKVNSKNAVLTSGDVLEEDLPMLISKAVASLSAEDFVIVR